MDFTTYTDEDLAGLVGDAQQEQERRAQLAAIPAQVAALAALFREGGGDEAALQNALTPDEVAAIAAQGA